MDVKDLEYLAEQYRRGNLTLIDVLTMAWGYGHNEGLHDKEEDDDNS